MTEVNQEIYLILENGNKIQRRQNRDYITLH